jgi:hypothetical protein
MDHRGPLDQVSPLHTRIYYIKDQTVCRALHVTYCSLSWHPEDQYLQQRIYLSCLLLEATA